MTLSRPRAEAMALALALMIGLTPACADRRPEGAAQPVARQPSPEPREPQLPSVEPGQNFYDHPAQIPAGEPGRVVRLQPLKTPDGIKGWRVLYHSTAVDGRDIVVSGLIFAPASPAEPGSRPVISWGHGSVGLGDSCAPSRYPQGLAGQPVLAELLERGFVVAATDYEGLGTPGVHPWLVGLSEGRGVLDIVRAARQIPGSGAGNRFLAFGASQGGGAVLFAGELAATYAKDLTLLGVAAAAPAAELDLLALLPEQDLAGISGFVVMGALGFAAAYPNLPLEAILQPGVIAQRQALEQLCQSDIDRRFRGVPLSRILTTAPATAEPWAGAIAENTPGRRRTSAPVLLVHGSRDRVVPVEVSHLLFDRLCRLGVRAEKQVYEGVDHGEIIDASREDVLSWIAGRSDGSRVEDRPGVERCL